MVGPYNDEIRILIAFIEPTEVSYKMQTMIIDLAPLKNRNEEPSSVQVDLTSTIRSLSTEGKQQKIVILRWKQTGELELKCDGKWVKKDAASSTDKIIEVTKAVIQSVPLDAKTPTEVTLPQETEQKVSSLLNALHTENFPCLRTLR
ncbi:MAG TPA: hypothetical protein VF791_13725 [Pyrinomonadaceae bacterium]